MALCTPSTTEVLSPLPNDKEVHEYRVFLLFLLPRNLPLPKLWEHYPLSKRLYKASLFSFFSTQHHTQGQGSSKPPSRLTQALLLAFLLQAPAPLFIPMVRTCCLRAIISPGCFCPGSENDPLKKQLVQHLGKEEPSIENKIQETASHH